MFWSLLIQLSRIISNLLPVLVVARQLGPAYLGLNAIPLIAFNLAIEIVDQTATTTIIHEWKSYKVIRKYAWALATLLLATILILNSIYSENIILRLSAVYALSLFVSVPNLLLRPIWSLNGRLSTIALRNFVSPLIATVFLVLILYSKLDFYALPAFYLIVSVSDYALIQYFYKKDGWMLLLRSARISKGSTDKRQVSSSLVFTILRFLAMRFDQILYSSRMPIVELGFYAQASRLYNASSGLLIRPVSIVQTALYVQNKNRENKNTTNNEPVYLSFALISFSSIIIILFSEQAVLLTLGKEWKEVGRIFWMHYLAAFPTAFLFLTGNHLLLTGNGLLRIALVVIRFFTLIMLWHAFKVSEYETATSIFISRECLVSLFIILFIFFSRKKINSQPILTTAFLLISTTPLIALYTQIDLTRFRIFIIILLITALVVASIKSKDFLLESLKKTQ